MARIDKPAVIQKNSPAGNDSNQAFNKKGN